MKENGKRKPVQPIRLDFNYIMSDFVGEAHGISREDIEGIEEQATNIHRQLAARRKRGELGFFDLACQDNTSELVRLARKIARSCRNFVVLGIGGSALGATALHRALNPPFYNLLTEAGRKGPRFFVADNVDPDGFKGLMDVLDLKETIFNVISKSGGTAETMSQFLYVRDRLIRKLGREGHRPHIVITTDREKGRLREIVNLEGYTSLEVPRTVGGRFSVLSPVGLLPAAVVGIDIAALLSGARDMDGRCKVADIWRNPAYMNGALCYLADVRKGKRINVMMPYSDALYGVADWFRQLWAESLGKKLDLNGNPIWAGQTPARALGVTDQHSQLQLYMEGPNDKILTFLVVERFRTTVRLPKSYPDLEGVGYLGGHSLNELIGAEQKATELALVRAGRPNSTIFIPQVNAYTVGQLLFLLELQTVFTGGLYNVNPLDQPGVEEGKQFTYGLMGRSGFEYRLKEFETRPEKQGRYVI